MPYHAPAFSHALLQSTDFAGGKPKTLSLLLLPSQLLHNKTPETEQGCYKSQCPPQEEPKAVLGPYPRGPKDILALLPFSVQAQGLLCTAPFMTGQQFQLCSQS